MPKPPLNYARNRDLILRAASSSSLKKKKKIKIGQTLSFKVSSKSEMLILK